MVLLSWFSAAYYTGAEQVLVNTRGDFLAPIAITAVVPVALFLALYALLPKFRQAV